MLNRALGKVYQKRPGHWYIQLPGKVRIYCDKQHQSLDSEKRARTTLIQIYTEIENGTFDPDFYRPSRKSELSFSVYAERWLEFRHTMVQRGRLGKSHNRNSGYVVRKLFMPFFGDMDIRSIRGKHIRDFQLSLTCGPKTTYDRLALLMKLFRDAQADEVIKDIPNVPDKLTMADIPDPDWQWIDEETQDKIFAELDEEALFFIKFQAFHGTRTGETRALQHQDIDLVNGAVTICRALSDWEVKTTKTKRIRVIPLDQTWKDLYRQRPKAFDKTAWVFQRDGKPYEQKVMPRRWAAACKRLGLEGVGLYEGTRHSLASQAANRGVSLFTIGKLLGHTDAKTTQRYAHVNVETLRAVQRQPLKKLERKVR